MSKKIFSVFKLLALALLLSFGISTVFAWTVPTQTPPLGNAPAPLNVGATNQTKVGGITAGSLTSNTLTTNTLTISTGASVGKVLTSDATGKAAWASTTVALLPPGTSGQTLRHNGAEWVANSVIFNTGVSVGINDATPSYTLDVNGTVRATSNIYANNFYLTSIGKWASDLGEQPRAAVDTNGNWTWTRVVSDTYRGGNGNRSSGWNYVTLNATKPVLGIRISGASDDGGLCIAGVYGYFMGAVTNKAYVTDIDVTGGWSGMAWNQDAGPMLTKSWTFDSTSAGRSLGAQTYDDNSAYNKAAGFTFIPAGETLQYAQWYNSGQGDDYNTCYVDVLYATYY